MSRALSRSLACCIALFSTVGLAAEKPPTVGEKAADFTLMSLEGEKVQLSSLTKQGPAVLVVLRGYPGYQCPACTAQAGDFLSKAKQFAAAKANVVLIYPGESAGLTEHAQEFIRGKTLPKNVYLVTDPDFKFTSQYKIRWEQAGETAYPATFVVDGDGKIRFAQMSKTHGDRTKATAVLAELKKL